MACDILLRVSARREAVPTAHAPHPARLARQVDAVRGQIAAAQQAQESAARADEELERTSLVPQALFDTT